MLVSSELQALWDRIKHKTTYRVHFDNENCLVEKGACAVQYRYTVQFSATSQNFANLLIFNYFFLLQSLLSFARLPRQHTSHSDSPPVERRADSIQGTSQRQPKSFSMRWGLA